MYPRVSGSDHPPGGAVGRKCSTSLHGGIRALWRPMRGKVLPPDPKNGIWPWVDTWRFQTRWRLVDSILLNPSGPIDHLARRPPLRKAGNKLSREEGNASTETNVLVAPGSLSLWAVVRRSSLLSFCFPEFYLKSLTFLSPTFYFSMVTDQNLRHVCPGALGFLTVFCDGPITPLLKLLADSHYWP